MSETATPNETPKTAGRKRKKSGGEIAVNFSVYKVIGFGVNEFSSLWITNQWLYGKNLFANLWSPLEKIGRWFSKEGFADVSSWLAGALKIKDKIKDGKRISGAARAGNGLLMVTLLSGGTLLLLPMKWLEDHKTYWVKKANHVIDWLCGSKMSEAEVVKRDSEVEQAIACSPRQSWWSMLIGRVIACTASVGTGTLLVGAKHNDQLMNASEKFFTGSIHPENTRTTKQGWARLLPVETYSCAISSSVLEFSSYLLAKLGMQVHDPELCKAKNAPPAAAGGSDDAGAGSCAGHCDKIKAEKARAADGVLTMF